MIDIVAVADEGDEPSPFDLAEIEAEWPLIEAELALLDAEIRIVCASGGGSVLDWRRLRRAERRVLREAAAWAGRSASSAVCLVRVRLAA
jgi:hypothetical protein